MALSHDDLRPNSILASVQSLLAAINLTASKQLHHGHLKSEVFRLEDHFFLDAYSISQEMLELVIRTPIFQLIGESARDVAQSSSGLLHYMGKIA